MWSVYDVTKSVRRQIFLKMSYLTERNASIVLIVRKFVVEALWDY